MVDPIGFSLSIDKTLWEDFLSIEWCFILPDRLGKKTISVCVLHLQEKLLPDKLHKEFLGCFDPVSSCNNTNTLLRCDHTMSNVWWKTRNISIKKITTACIFLCIKLSYILKERFFGFPWKILHIDIIRKSVLLYRFYREISFRPYFVTIRTYSSQRYRRKSSKLLRLSRMVLGQTGQ